MFLVLTIAPSFFSEVPDWSCDRLTVIMNTSFTQLVEMDRFIPSVFLIKINKTSDCQYPFLTPISIDAKPRPQPHLLLLPVWMKGPERFLRWILGVLDLKAPILCRHPAFLSNGDKTSQNCLKSTFNIQPHRKHGGGNLLPASFRPRRLSF